MKFTLSTMAQRHLDRSPHITEFDLLGFIPDMLSEHDFDKAVSQIDRNYPHGGGWRPMKGFTYHSTSRTLHYPGDNPRVEIASAKLRDEEIILFQNSWVAVVQPDGTYQIARID